MDSGSSSDSSDAAGSSRGAARSQGNVSGGTSVSEIANSGSDVDLDGYGGRFSPFSIAYAQYLRYEAAMAFFHCARIVASGPLLSVGTLAYGR